MCSCHFSRETKFQVVICVKMVVVSVKMEKYVFRAVVTLLLYFYCV